VDADVVGDVPGRLLPLLRGQVEPAAKESFNQLKLLRGHGGYGFDRWRCGGRGTQLSFATTISAIA
jgi:hypothetical protein